MHVATLPNPYTDPDAYTFITTTAFAGGKLFLALGVYGSSPGPRDVQLWVSDGQQVPGRCCCTAR